MFAPKLVSWGITNACNLNCTYCYRNAGAKLNEELTTHEGFKLLREIKRAGGKMVVLSGGEPLMREDFFELASYGRSLGLAMLLATNGVLMNGRMAGKVKEAGIRLVSFNLDGPTAEVHDREKGLPGAFDRTVNGIRACIKAGIEVQINFTVTKENAELLPDMVRLMDRLGVHYMHVFTLVPTGRGRLEPTKEQVMKVIKYIAKLKRPGVKPTCTPYYWAYMAKEGDDEEFLKRYPTGCTAGISYAYISPVGDVYPCPYLPVKVGNVREKGFDEIWRDGFGEIRRRELKGRCGACEYAGICGGCRARAFAHSRDWMAEDPLCPIEVGKNV